MRNLKAGKTKKVRKGRGGDGVWICTFRLPLGIQEFLRQEAKERGVGRGRPISVNSCVVQVLEDLRAHFDLPSPVPSKLEEERNALGLGRRAYTRHVLMERYQQLSQRKDARGSPPDPR